MNDIGDIIASLRSAMPELQRQWPIGSLALFGSRVRDDATPVSDLDVLVEFTVRFRSRPSSPSRNGSP
jgi:predicted nucleotidyltransferase